MRDLSVRPRAGTLLTLVKRTLRPPPRGLPGHEAWAESVKLAMPRANASGAKPPGHAGSEDARGAQEGNGSACAQARRYGDS